MLVKNIEKREETMDTSNEIKNKYIAVCCVPSAGWAVFCGVLLITLGGLALLGAFIPLAHIGSYILPALLIIWGGAILVNLRLSRS